MHSRCHFSETAPILSTDLPAQRRRRKDQQSVCRVIIFSYWFISKFNTYLNFFCNVLPDQCWYFNIIISELHHELRFHLGLALPELKDTRYFNVARNTVNIHF